MWNKITAIMVLVTAVSLLTMHFDDVEARGGGRGGGGGGRGGGGGGRGGGGGGRGGGGGGRGGGAYRGGHTMNRTPSMSRASNRPAGSRQGQYVNTRPSGSQGRGQQARNTARQRPSAENRADLRNQVNRNIQNRPAQKLDRQDLAQRTQDFSNRRDNQLAQNRQVSDRVSNRLHDSHPDSRNWFDRDFFHHHDIDVNYVGTGANWWRPVAWASLATWGAWNWSTPYYYDNGGYSYPVTTGSAYTYPSISTPTTYQPVQTQSTESTQTAAAEGGDWLPLGVFAVGKDADAAAETNRFIQLALNRSGEIAGVLYNSTTDDAQDLVGMVDTANQKAYWSLSDRTDSPIASTGMYNLTEDQTPVDVQFSDGSEQTWTLVRLKQEK